MAMASRKDTGTSCLVKALLRDAASAPLIRNRDIGHRMGRRLTRL
jgi:hypothetical protein